MRSQKQEKGVNVSKKIEDGKTPQERYAKKKIKQFKIDCIITTEQDIIQRLESQTNKAGYIKKLIRDDIDREKK